MPLKLDDEVVIFEDLKSKKKNAWTVRDSFEGTQIFGATGSGKTTGSGRHLAMGMLQRGYGGLVLTVKPEDLADWLRYAADAKRSADLIVVEPGGDHRFNFMNYEYRHQEKQGKSLTQNLVSLFCNAMEAGQERDSTTDPYWEDALRQLLTNAIDLVTLATNSASLMDIAKVIRTAPMRRTEYKDEVWRKESFCWTLLKGAIERTTNDEATQDLDETLDYWSLEFAGLADRTRSVVVSSFTSKATSMLRRPLRALFCSDKPDTFSPDDSHRGNIIILNLPVKEYGEAGRFAQIIFKTVWQRATERRDEKKPDARPVFLWADESQHFVTSYDMLFQQTARAKHVATVYLTQNISNYYAQLSRRSGTATTDSLLGNLQTKIFHANGDPATNEWAERLFAKRLISTTNKTLNLEGSGGSIGRQQTFLPLVPAETFTALKKGGLFNEGIVEAVAFHAGKPWISSGEHFLLTRFRQPKVPQT